MSHPASPRRPPANREGRPEGRPFELLLVAVWFALLAGLGETAGLAVAKFVLHRYLHVGPHVTWMAPLALLLLFAGPALALSLIARLRPGRDYLRITVFLFAFLGFLSLLMHVQRLHFLSLLLLAAGLASVSTRAMAHRPRGFLRLVRRTTGWLVALVAALAVGVSGREAWAERHALAQLPPPTPDAPNVLLLVLDTVRAENLSVYGYPRRTTPHLERLAEIGVRFERPVATSPWTLPSHASLFTGRHPHDLSADWLMPLDGQHRTLAEILSAHGYVTAGFVANTYYCSRESGLARGFAHYEDYPIWPSQILASTSLGAWAKENRTVRRATGIYEVEGRKTASEVTRDFLRWLDRQDGRPFFAFLNYFDGHAPYLPPAPFDALFAPVPPWRNPLIWPEREWSAPEIQAEIDAYDGAIAYLDHHLGLLFGELERRHMLANTLIVLTGDHGEEFGEHGVFTHGHNLYWPVLHVPLLMSFPGRVPADRIIREPVSLRDVPATIADLLELESSANLPGTSLARLWENPGTRDPEPQRLLSEVSYASGLPAWFPVSQGDMKSLVFEGFHYIKTGADREELYDLEADPRQQRDLARSADGRRKLPRFRTAMQAMLGQSQ